MEDVVKNPSHYSKFKIQPKCFIRQNKLTWCQGNVVKYICRYDLKSKDTSKQIEDLEKAKENIDMMLEDLNNDDDQLQLLF